MTIILVQFLSGFCYKIGCDPYRYAFASKTILREVQCMFLLRNKGKKQNSHFMLLLCRYFMYILYCDSV